MSAKVTACVAKSVLIERLIEAEGNYYANDNGGLGKVDVDGSFRSTNIYTEEIQRCKFLWFSWTKKRVFLLGELWFQNPHLGANNKNLVLHVYGERFMKPALNLSKKISEEFTTLVHVRLERKDVTDVTPKPWWAPKTAM